MKTPQSKVVIRYNNHGSEPIFIASYHKRSNHSWNYSTCYSFDEAKDFQEVDTVTIAEVYSAFVDSYKESACEIIKITLTEEPYLDIDDTLFKEVRQKAALLKLTEHDIKVLGLGKVATYIKTKYHKS